MPEFAEPLSHFDQVIITLAVRSRCNISAELEAHIRATERARIAGELGEVRHILSHYPSRRRVGNRSYRSAARLIATIRDDERRVIVRELRREAGILFGAGLDSDALVHAAKRVEGSL